MSYSKFDIFWWKLYSFLRIWSHLLKKSLSENSIFCIVQLLYITFINWYVSKETTKLNTLSSVVAFTIANIKSSTCILPKVKETRSYRKSVLIWLYLISNYENYPNKTWIVDDGDKMVIVISHPASHDVISLRGLLSMTCVFT